MKRVKFFSAYDMSIGFYLDIVHAIIQSFDDTKEITNINDIIEMYNIKCFFDNKIYSSKWSREEKDKYEQTVSRFPRYIGKFFGCITNTDFVTKLQAIEMVYLADFWYLVEYYKVYTKLSSEDFKKVIVSSNFRLRDILKYQQITEYFGQELSEHILTDSKYAELLMDKYVTKKESNVENIYFPVQLTEKKKEELLLMYVRSSNPNINYLELLYNSQSSKDLPIPDTTKLEAKRKHQELIEQLFKDSAGIEFGVEVFFSDSQKEIKEFTYDSGKLRVSYSIEWIQNNLNYTTLLNNFIFLFEYVDAQSRSLHVAKEYQLGIFERIVGIKGRKYYIKGIAFDQTQALSVLQMRHYRKILEQFGIRFEELLQWYFDKYISDQYGINNFRITMPSENSTDLEKCRMIVTELEGILKQFALMVKHGEIDHDLLHLSSTQLFYKDVPSYVNKKYLYGTGTVYEQATYFLFSDQSMLAYIPRIGEKYSSFFELLCHEEVYENDYELYEAELSWLIDKEFLFLDNNKRIIMYVKRVFLIKDLYENGVGCISYLQEYTEEIQWMIINKMVEVESSLFSKPEQNYLNYLMNRSEYSNGLDLRNKYIHATQSFDPESHNKDYNIFLNILVLIIFKINEELKLRQMAL